MSSLRSQRSGPAYHLPVAVARLFVLFGRHDHPFVDLIEHIRAEWLTKVCHEGGGERRGLLQARRANEVLEVWVLRDVLDRVSVTQSQSLLDNERPESHADRHGLLPALGDGLEQGGVVFFHQVPWDELLQLPPSIFSSFNFPVNGRKNLRGNNNCLAHLRYIQWPRVQGFSVTIAQIHTHRFDIWTPKTLSRQHLSFIQQTLGRWCFVETAPPSTRRPAPPSKSWPLRYSC